jgi:hypothetical protein
LAEVKNNSVQFLFVISYFHVLLLIRTLSSVEKGLNGGIRGFKNESSPFLDLQ